MPLQTIFGQLKKFCLLIALTVRYCLFARACFRVLGARGFRSRASVLSRQESSLVQTFGEDFASLLSRESFSAFIMYNFSLLHKLH